MDRLNTVQTIEVTGATLGRLNYWVKLGLVKPRLTKPGAGGERSFAWIDLVVLQAIRLLSDASRVDRLQQFAELLRKLGQPTQKGGKDAFVIVHADGTTSTFRSKTLAKKLRHDPLATFVYPFKLWDDVVGHSTELNQSPIRRRGRPRDTATRGARRD